MLPQLNLAATVLALAGVGQALPPTISNAKPVPIGKNVAGQVDGPTPEIVVFNAGDMKASTTAAPVNLTSFNPDESNIAKRYIIGDDNRNLVTDTKAWPHRAVGKVEGNGYWCSGTLVGPRHVLTARHCVGGEGGVKFTPGYDNGAAPYGSSNAYVVGFINYGSECTQEWDFAIIVLNDRLGDKTGYYGTKVFDANTQMNQPMFGNTGYPGDRDSGNRMYNQAFIPAHRNRECGTAMLVGTVADTAGGQSGGPLWAWGSNNAVDVYGALSASSNYEATFGGGPEMITLLTAMRQQHP